MLDQPTAESLFNGPVTEVVQAATKQLVKALELKSKRCDLVSKVVHAACIDHGSAAVCPNPMHGGERS